MYKLPIFTICMITDKEINGFFKYHITSFTVNLDQFINARNDDVVSSDF
jgi:hypothetical protein